MKRAKRVVSLFRIENSGRIDARRYRFPTEMMAMSYAAMAEQAGWRADLVMTETDSFNLHCIQKSEAIERLCASGPELKPKRGRRS